MPMRSVMTSPPTTLPLVTSQPVAPPTRLLVSQLFGFGSSKPVPASSCVPVHVLIVPFTPPLQPVLPFTHCVKRPVLPYARLTPTGTFCVVPVGWKNARFLSMGFAGCPVYVESRSTTKKSLNAVHVYSGNSALKKLTESWNDFAFVGTRTRSVSISASFAPAIDGGGQPGAFGSMPPFAARKSAGKPVVFVPACV